MVHWRKKPKFTIDDSIETNAASPDHFVKSNTRNLKWNINKESCTVELYTNHHQTNAKDSQACHLQFNYNWFLFSVDRLSLFSLDPAKKRFSLKQRATAVRSEIGWDLVAEAEAKRAYYTSEDALKRISYGQAIYWALQWGTVRLWTLHHLRTLHQRTLHHCTLIVPVDKVSLGNTSEHSGQSVPR